MVTIDLFIYLVRIDKQVGGIEEATNGLLGGETSEVSCNALSVAAIRIRLWIPEAPMGDVPSGGDGNAFHAIVDSPHTSVSRKSHASP